MSKFRIILKHKFTNADGSIYSIQFVSFLGLNEKARKRLLKRGYCPALPLPLTPVLFFRGLPARVSFSLVNLEPDSLEILSIK